MYEAILKHFSKILSDSFLFGIKAVESVRQNIESINLPTSSDDLKELLASIEIDLDDLYVRIKKIIYFEWKLFIYF